MSAASILVIDDDEFVRGALRRALHPLGQEDVIEAGTGEEALKELGKADVSFALVDLRMPGMGGHEAIRRIAAQNPLVPLVGMSGEGDMHDVIECLRDGAVDFLVKPWTAGELAEVVTRTLARRKARLEPARLGSISPAQVAPDAPAARGSLPPADSPGGPVAREGPITLSEVLARLRQGEIALPAQPTVALVVRRMLARHDVSAGQIRAVIERDPHFTGRILRLANSPLFVGYARAPDLGAAIARIGNREIGMVVETLFARRFFEVATPKARAIVDAQWRRSWARAVCMRQAAIDLFPSVPPETAYLTGLFCDAGAAFLVRVSDEMGLALNGVELATIAESHAAISATIASAWDLPAEVIEACRDHHGKGQASDRSQLLCLLGLAELVCKELQLPEDLAPIEVAPDLLSHLGISRAQVERLKGQTVERLRQSKALLE